MSYTEGVEARLRADSAEIIGRHPSGRSHSALLPILHLVQSQDGYVSPDGIALIADILGIIRTEVDAVVTSYTQCKRHPTGDYLVGVRTNSLYTVMGGDVIWETASTHIGVSSDETNESGRITLERIKCNAACDYAPAVMANWGFFDNQTSRFAITLVDDLEAGHPARPTHGAQEVPTFKENERTLAGPLDGHESEDPSAGEPSLPGLRIAAEKGWNESLALDDTKGGEQE